MADDSGATGVHGPVRLLLCTSVNRLETEIGQETTTCPGALFATVRMGGVVEEYNKFDTV